MLGLPELSPFYYCAKCREVLEYDTKRKTSGKQYLYAAAGSLDLFCGLGGWAEGFLAEGYDVVGFDIERHDYGTGGYPGQLVLQDALTLHGSQFKDATVIVASPPCQKYSYMAMPWSKAKALIKHYEASPENRAELTALFDACFRIQREASEAAGRHIPLIVENVRGAQRWVGRAKANYGSYYLWGDVGMVGRRVVAGPAAIRAGSVADARSHETGSSRSGCPTSCSTFRRRSSSGRCARAARPSSRTAAWARRRCSSSGPRTWCARRTARARPHAARRRRSDGRGGGEVRHRVHRSLRRQRRPGHHITNYERLHYFNPPTSPAWCATSPRILKSSTACAAADHRVHAEGALPLLDARDGRAERLHRARHVSSEALGLPRPHGHAQSGSSRTTTTAINRPRRRFMAGERETMGQQVALQGPRRAPFWRWVCSWARAVRKPSDLGFDDTRVRAAAAVETSTSSRRARSPRGMLFAAGGGSRSSARSAARTIELAVREGRGADAPQRRAGARLVPPERRGDLLERLIPDAAQVSGADSDEAKEEKFLAFARGELRVLVTKPKIGAWGLNFQHCAHVTTFPSHSFEQYYQGIRRCWRFGQTRRCAWTS
jgi:hypothetical protein